MSLKIKFFLIFTLLITPIFADNAEINYYSLNNLEKAAPPKRMKLIILNENNNPVLKEGILFSYKSRKAIEVEIAGNFSNWKPIKLNKGFNGIWTFFFHDKFDKEVIKYKFLVDGAWITDPENTFKEDDLYGSYLSVTAYSFEEKEKYISYQIVENNTVEFRYYSPSASFVSVVGDFNNWNPENDILEKDSHQVWRLKKIIPAGVYRYKLIVDGRWIADIYNPESASDELNGICSVLKVRN